jgi:hypothetical protein
MSKILAILLAHGLWVWKASSVLAAPHGAEALRDFCARQGITEVYVSSATDAQLEHLIPMLHAAHIRVEALLSSIDADEPGPHREKLLAKVDGVQQFNASHPSAQLDGIHLDIEPQQRPENKGVGNLAFLPGLIDVYRAVRQRHLPVDADIPIKLIKGTPDQRRALLTSLPRFTLMLYEQKSDDAASKALSAAYDGLDGTPDVAHMAIALRTADHGDRLPQALAALDDAERGNPHYAGWAWHAY